jgi:hypothetical protein
MSVSTVGNWSANFLVSSFFLTLTTAITRQGTFWLYAGFGVLALIFFITKLPETKDRTLEEIEREVSGSTDDRPSRFDRSAAERTGTSRS